MQQGLLFEPEVTARTELQDAIARLDFHSAVRRLEEFHRFWPEAKLIWEPELVRAGSKLASKPMEIRQIGDGWKVRLQLGNCDFRLGHGAVAHSNYHWSFLLGLPDDGWALIEDPRFLARLRSADEAEWAFPELCAAVELPPARFSARREFDGFKRKFGAAFIESPSSRRFCLYWIVSENKLFCSDGELIDSRRQLRALHPRLHVQYMQHLGQVS